MSSKKVGGFLGKLWSQGKEKSPALLAGYACVGVALAVYTMYKAAPKADAIIKDKQKKMKELKPEQKEEKSKLVKKNRRRSCTDLDSSYSFGCYYDCCSNRVSEY